MVKLDVTAKAVGAVLAALLAGSVLTAPAAAARRSTHKSADQPIDIGQPAAGRAGAKTAAAKPADATTPQSLGQFGDWQAFQVGSGKAHSCFAISNPKDRQPAGLTRDPATLFITHRPTEGVRNEISIIAGFTMKDGADATLKVGSASYALYTKDANAWVKNAAEQATILGTMRKSHDVSFVGTSKRGRTTTDSYSLGGFSSAVDAISKACS